MRTFKIGGIHPADNKLTAGCAITQPERPVALTVLTAQSIGKPARPVVKAGDEVKAGQLLAEADGFVSANVHSPLSGKVKKIERTRTPQGYWADAILIEVASGEEPAWQPLPEEEIGTLSPPEIVALVRAAGVVGLGGATFPTDVKLTPPKGSEPQEIILNGAECEPYLTCDDRLMREQPREILLGAKLLMKAAGVSRCYVGIEDNKPEAIAAMKCEAEALGGGIEVVTLRKKYPQGGEKQLIDAITRRQVASGALPVSVGAIVDNVATAKAVYDAVYLRRPLTHRVVTVTGPELTAPGNFLVPVGLPLRTLIEYAGGLPESTGKVVAGGPMMGRAVSDLDAPSGKGLSGILVLPESMSRRGAEQPCIRCGKCLYGCPMGLEPYLLLRLARHERWDDMRREHAMDCIECGSCSWSCPSQKPLLDFIKLGKSRIKKLK